MRRATALAVVVVVAATGAAVVMGLSRRGADEGARCGPGFVAEGARCLPGERCPPPLTTTAHGCDAPDSKILVPEVTLTIGPSDWEAEGRVAPRTLHAGPFRIDAFEVTRGALGETVEPARAASNVARDEAQAFCAGRGGRLPSEDEWIAAAASATSPARRYPWGDTGAVCRRAAWGLSSGPCARGLSGPDTVGAHPDGDTPLHLHDLAGNVAEWVATGPRDGVGVAKGGDWATDLAADLRIWARRELAAGARDPRVGFRCVYPP